MALSLPGERSVAAGSHVTPLGAFFAWFAQVKTQRARRSAVRGLLELDHARLKDLGISQADVAEALNARYGRSPGMVLNAARARSACF